MWSGQEKKQIIGRAWRFGQMVEVMVVDIIAPRGLDLAIAGYAGGKTVLSSSFLRSERELHQAHAAFEAMEFESEPEESDVEELPADLPAAKKSKVVERKRKATAVNPAGTRDVGHHQPAVPSVKKKGPKLPPVVTSAQRRSVIGNAPPLVCNYTKLRFLKLTAACEPGHKQSRWSGNSTHQLTLLSLAGYIVPASIPDSDTGSSRRADT